MRKIGVGDEGNGHSVSGTLALRFSGFGWRALEAWVEMHAFSSNVTTDLASATPSPICSFATKERLSGHLGLCLNDGNNLHECHSPFFRCNVWLEWKSSNSSG
jgi:hypothetical protein